jgi:hypothetical protein
MHDIFISFKNLDKSGKPTRDSLLAREVFDGLSDRGFSVFFSPISLERLGVSAYKVAIDEALDSSRVLVAVGTSAENLDAQWVRYEWDGFFNDILSGIKPDGRVFVYVEGCEPRSLPRALRQSQVFNRADGGLEKLANFVANALGASADTRSSHSETSHLVLEQSVASPPMARPPSPSPPAKLKHRPVISAFTTRLRRTNSGAGQYAFAYQKELAERFGPQVVPLAEPYPFLKRYWAVSDQERIYRSTNHLGPSGDKEVACRICGNRQEWDKYPSRELPKTCPSCKFEGDFSARVFVAYARADSTLAEVIIKELERAQFRIKRSGLTRTNGGWLDLERLRRELDLCKACVSIWSNGAEDDRELMSELATARDAGIPVLFLKVGQLDPQAKPDTERVLDLNGPASWDALLINTLCDSLTVDEKRRRESSD